MATIDPTVARVLDRQKADDSDDEDALIAELEEDDSKTFSALREKRLEQLHSEMNRAKIQGKPSTAPTWKSKTKRH